MKRILRSSRRVRIGDHRSPFLTLFLLCSSFFLLSLTADGYVECVDVFPDEVLDIFGLIQIPVKDPVIPFLLIFLVINPGSIHHNHTNLLSIDLSITSNILACTVIRI